MTRDELAERMSTEEFAGWRILYALEPWGDYRTELHLAQLRASLDDLWRAYIAASHGGRRRSGRPFDDYLIDWFGEIRRARGEAVWGRLKGMLRAAAESQG